jgi:hypothetical protein
LRAAEASARDALPPSAVTEGAPQPGARRPSLSELVYDDHPLDAVLAGAMGIEHRPSDELEQRMGYIDTVGQVAEVEEVPGVGPMMDFAQARAELQRGDFCGAAIKGAKGLLGTKELAAATQAGAEAGTALSPAGVGLALLDWAFNATKSIGEAHEAGDRDSRISIYAAAYADGLLEGEHQNLGLITEEQRAAMERGLADGREACAKLGDRAPLVGQLLLREYGSKDGVRHAVIDGLLARAGMDGIDTTQRARRAGGAR